MQTGEGDLNVAGDKFPLTDIGNAERFLSRYSDQVKFNHTSGKWLVWTEKRWERDATNVVMEFAKRTATVFLDESMSSIDSGQRKTRGAFAMLSQNRGKLDAMLRLAESDPRIRVTEDELDRDPYLLNLDNGVYDFRTHELRAHDKALLQTRMASVQYGAGAQSPHWNAFMQKIFSGDMNLVRYVQKCQGASLIGRSQTQILPFCYGQGANGKSTYMEAVRIVLGDYWQKAPLNMLLKQSSGSIPNDVARLSGARMVVASETQEGSLWDEAKVKDLTGGDTITARFLYKEYFEFTPSHTVWVYGNHLPQVRGDDEGIWRRIKLIPFAVQIPAYERRPMPEMLREFEGEKSGILNWMIDGYKQYVEEGLQDPPQVISATHSYRTNSDVVSTFLAESCERNAAARVELKDLYNSYVSWCNQTGERGIEKREFVLKLKNKDLEKRQGSANKTILVGIKLRCLEPIHGVNEVN